ncbi:hypothetical protein JTE90_002573 [Oedothorax gibbosus]|uniref:Uncharacterized protein n=1 Tax=Oedothorax gibbosus TaxID=931172 RepID=A0AAV6TRZ7_9ARAC|nr:hypothetical protein JTE90_002573 [Oedothorax gibbosus]
MENVQIVLTSLKIDKTTENENLNDLKWHAWKKYVDGKLKKVLEEGNTEDLAGHIQTLMPHFLRHVYTKREQAFSYKKQIEASTSKSFDLETAILQVDFVENYACSYQDEVQSAYWQ